MGNNIDIDLFTQKSEITTSTPDITIEITGLVQLNSFIGLDDTPTYYENGKFFKVEDNKIVYTDINWGDVKGKIADNPELVKEIGEFIQKETEQYTSEAVTKAIKAHDADANAHQSIQLTIQDNYTTLDNKIELNKIDSNTKFDEVNKKVSDNTEYITRVDNYSQEVNKKLEDLTLEVDVDIKGDIKQLRDDLTTTNQTVQDNYTALDTKIDNVSTDVQNNYTALDTRISANTKDISDLTQTVQNDYKELNDHITNVNSKVTTNTTNINKNTELINQTVENLKKYSKTEDFATVAFTGRYADLIDIPNNIATTEYVDGKIGEVVQFSFIIVDELPKVGETNHIYLVLNKTGKTGNVYLEYLWIESTQSYELIGSTEVDLSGYYTKEQTDNLLTQKVDKVDGKSLILDTEIERLGTLKNYDDTDIKQSVSDLSTKVDTKQDKLTAGTGIKIENNVISNTQTSAEWGNIQGDITAQEDLQNTLNTKVDKVEGKSLILDTEIKRLKTLKNYDDTQIKTDITNINSALETKASTTDLENGLKIKQDKLTFDTTPTANSTKPVTSGGIKTALDKKIDTTRETKYMPLLYTKQSVSNPTNMVAQPYIKLATVTFKNTNNYDLSQLFWLEYQRASTFKAHALVKLTARWSKGNYEGQVFEILEDYNGGNAEWENILKSLTWAYKFTAKTSTTGNILTGEIWIKIPNTQYCTYYLRPTECNSFNDYGLTTVTVTNNPWVYTNGNNQNVASITTGYTQVKVVDKSTYTLKANKTDLDTKQDKLTFDTVPTADSTNPVTSSGIKNALENITIKVDNTTISKSTENVISTIGIKTKNDINAYDWIGTQSEYATDLASGVITETTRCYITDDEQELIGDIGVSIPTKVSDLSNDSGFVNQQELDTKQDKLTAGNGISIQNNIISSTGSSVKWGNITGSISEQTDLYDSLARKVTKVEGKSLISNTEIDRLKNVHNYDDTELRSTRATTDLSNLTTTGEKHFLNKSQITNCLREIPQRIKYTLENGTLTIKAGSVVIVPYGTEDKTADLPKGATFINENFKVYDTQFSDGKFFVWAELVNDISSSYTVSDTLTRIVSIAIKTNEITDSLDSVSSATPSASQYTIVYNLSTNLIGYTHENSTIYYGEHIPSLPIMLAVGNGKTPYASINQVFNGMGYIGSTVWVDKGVKGLAPNGRNADGSLNNLEYTRSKLSLNSVFDPETTYLQSDAIGIGEVETPRYHETETEPKSPNGWNVWYKPSENIAYLKNIGDSSSKWTPQYMQTGLAEIVRGDNGKITSFAPKLPFRALDYSDKTKITNWSFPSDKYIDLTLGASGATYTAPADGWISFRCWTTAVNSEIRIFTEEIDVTNRANISDSYQAIYAPVRKGKNFLIFYENKNNSKPSIQRFYYAVGSEPVV